MEPVIALADAAPDIPGWRVERFRRPGPEDMCIEYKGLSVDASGIRIAYQVDKDEPLLHLAMLIPGYDEADQRYIGIGFLNLDHMIGEYNTIMHIGHLEFRSFDGVPPNAHLLTLVELRRMIEAEFY